MRQDCPTVAANGPRDALIYFSLVFPGDRDVTRYVGDKLAN